MKQNLIKLLMGFAFLMLGTQAQALLLTPSDADLWGDETSASEIVSIIEGLYGVTELYKSNVRDKNDLDYGTDSSGIDEKAFAGSYDTVFTNSLTDPSDAWLTYNAGTSSIACPDCYLLVKDGDHNPAWYLFDLTTDTGTWNGTDDIHLEGFWPDGGAISHIAIFGREQSVPEPGILALLGLGLVGMIVSRRKAK